MEPAETLIFGSGMSAYFVKKNNPEALVISDGQFTQTLKSHGFFRTKGISGKSLFKSIDETACGLNDKNMTKAFCGFVPKIRKQEEFRNSKDWEHGFISGLSFIRKFEDSCLKGTLLKIQTYKGRVIGAWVQLTGEKKFIECKSIVICTGGYSQYLRKKSKKTGVEIAFNAGAKTKNLEFVFYHPFGIDGNVVPTESLKGIKLFDSRGRRLKELENILSTKNAHHRLSGIVQKFYKNNLKIKAKRNKQVFEMRPFPYYSLGGLKVNSSFMTNLKGLFAAGEAVSGFNGADRIGGCALSQCVYSGIVAGKESLKYAKKAKQSLPAKLNPKINFSKTRLNHFSNINSKQELEKGLLESKKKGNKFAKEFYCSALKRKKSLGCFEIKN